MSKKLGDLIKKLRKEKGYKSLRSFAKAIEKSPTFICKLERGECVPGVETLEKMGNMLGSKEEIFRLANKVEPELERLVKEPETACFLRKVSKMSSKDREEIFRNFNFGDK